MKLAQDPSFWNRGPISSTTWIGLTNPKSTLFVGSPPILTFPMNSKTIGMLWLRNAVAKRVKSKSKAPASSPWSSWCGAWCPFATSRNCPTRPNASSKTLSKSCTRLDGCTMIYTLGTSCGTPKMTFQKLLILARPRKCSIRICKIWFKFLTSRLIFTINCLTRESDVSRLQRHSWPSAFPIKYIVQECPPWSDREMALFSNAVESNADDVLRRGALCSLAIPLRQRIPSWIDRWAFQKRHPISCPTADSYALPLISSFVSFTGFFFQLSHCFIIWGSMHGRISKGTFGGSIAMHCSIV